MASQLALLRLVALLVGLGAALAAPAGAVADAGTIVVVVDTPPAGSTVAGPGVLRGWAADPAAASGTGVDRVEIYLDGERGSGTYLGAAAYGSARPDVARNLGDPRFVGSGFALPVALPAGPHTLAVYAHASGQPGDSGWSEPTVLAVLVGSPGPRVATGTAGPSPPAPRCLGIPTPFGPYYGLETPQSYGAIYPTDVPFVFGSPAFWATYGAPGAPAYIDFTNNTVYPNAYFYQPRPARGIPIAC